MDDETTVPGDNGSDETSASAGEPVVEEVKTATVISRIERLDRADLIGQTVLEVRTNFGNVLNIPADATPLVNNNPVTEDYLLQEDDTLVFSVTVGEKG
jgi:hypothetical protein